MAVALAYPESKRGRGNVDHSKSLLNSDISSAYLRSARFVLRHCRDKAGEGMSIIQNAKSMRILAREHSSKPATFSVIAGTRQEG